MLLRNAVEEAAINPGAALEIALAGATPGRLGFIAPATFASNDDVVYGIRGLVAGQVKTEGGVGKVIVGPPTLLRRETVDWNSDGTTDRLNFTGTCLVFCEVPAERAVFLRRDKLIRASPAAIGGALWAGAATGNALTATTPMPFESGVKQGTLLLLGAVDAPTGAVTIAVNGAAAVPLLTAQNSRQCGAGDWDAGDTLSIVWDGANWRLLTLPRPASVPVGAMLPYTSYALPPRCIWPDGRNVSRTTYPKLAALYAASGYPFGAGDGSTTFAVPDARGRTIAGRDNLGDGAAANRITSGASGISGNTLGAAGGNQNMQSHAHSVSDPGHGHSVNDPGHAHSYEGSNGDTNAPTPGGTALFTDRATKTTGGAGTGISINGSGAGISINNQGAGSSQNMPPTLVLNFVLYAGD